jgi:phosphatidylserine/phosphatidylglycerophosphate/cardiolipin synthase-like enzyme
MPTVPSPTFKDIKLMNQQPAPPVARGSEQATILPTRNVERRHGTSTRFNTLACASQLWVDWVMQSEVPKPQTEQFLQWPTRRAFVEDKVQLRIQVNGHVLDASAEVSIALGIQGGPPSEALLRIVSSALPGMLPFRTELRSLAAAAHPLGEMTESDTEPRIFFEADPAHRRSFLVTTIKLPERSDAPGAAEHDTEFYVASVDIRHRSAHYSAQSPPIEVCRWWSTADQNMALPRTTATALEHLIDGETFFGRVADALINAAAGQSIYIAGWSTNSLVFLSGGHDAPHTGAEAPDFDNAIAGTLAGHIRWAAHRGANIYILLDIMNGGWGSELGQYLAGHFSPAERQHIFIRTAAHPYRPSFGVGPFKTAPEQVGTYHEKYVCITGGGVQRALVGGIDFGPDQYSPLRHAWRCDYNDYRDLCANKVGGGTENFFQSELMLWHDIAVRVEAQSPVQYLADDFIRRWNDGNGDANFRGPNLPAPVIAPPPSGGNVQLVKTEYIQGSGRVTRPIANGKYYGTFDVWCAAIREARHYIYMENQYIRDPALCDALCDALKKNSILQLIVVVPFLSEEQFRSGADAQQQFPSGYVVPLILKMKLWYDPQKQQEVKNELVDRMKVHHGNYLAHEFVRKLRAASASRFGLFTLANAASGAPEMIYPHSKIMIVDDTWAYIGSANANGKSMKIDGEVGFAFHDRAAATAFRQRLWSEHFQTNWHTRSIRDFLTKWRTAAVAEKHKVTECTAADFAGGVQAVRLANVPAGQKYNGPGSWLHNVDDEV